MSGRHAAVYINNGPVNKVTFGNGINNLRYIIYFTHTVYQMKACTFVSIITMHRCTDNARGNGINPDILLAKFSSQLNGKCMYSSLAGYWCCRGCST